MSCDVFISHHGGDTKREFAVWLSRDLMRRGFTCFFDERSLQRGDPAWATIMEALSGAKVVVVVLSKGFFTSKHCMYELHQCRVQGKKVVPIFFDITPGECLPAAAQRHNVPWDGFVGEWDGTEWSEDVQWVTGITGLRLEALDGFWDTCVDHTIQDVARLLGRPAVDDLTKVAKIPFARNNGFVGRESELIELKKILEEHKKALVTGLGGMGKTQVLLEYVYRHKGRFAKVLWIDGALQNRLANFLGLADHLGAQLEKETVDAEAENIGRVREALEKAEAPCLLVMDNVDDGAGLWDILPRDGLCQTLISTRVNSLDDIKRIRLSELDEEDALKLLRGDKESLDDEALRTIANKLGRLPIALAVSSRILREDMTPTELIGTLDEKGVEIFNEEGEDDKYKKEPNLVKLFDISMELVKRKDSPKSRLAEAMVKVGGWFASAPIPLGLLARAAKWLSPDLHEKDAPDSFRLLVRYSLGDRNEHASFHQLIQGYGRFLGGQEAGRAVVCALITEWGSLGVYPLEKDRAVHFQNAYDLTIPGTKPTDIFLEGGEQLGVVQVIGIHLAWYYVGRGQLANARALVDTFPEDGDPRREMQILLCRGGVLEASGEFPAALQHYLQALHIGEPACLHTGVQCDGCLAFPIQGMRFKSLDEDDYDLCGSCYEEGGTIEGRFTLVDPPDVSSTLNLMAGVLKRQGKYNEALPLYGRNLIMFEEALGEEHPFVALSLSRVGELLCRQGKHQEALAIHQGVLAHHENTLGPDHPDVGESLNNMAEVLWIQGKYEEALPLYERALAIRERELGPDHLDVAESLVNLAALFQSQSKFEKALPLHERALGICEEVLGPDHPGVAPPLNNLAVLFHRQGKYREALSRYERALAIGERAMGPDHPEVAKALNNIAELLRTQGKYQEARPFCERALAILEKELGPDHPDVALSLNNVAALLQSEGKYQEAVPFCERAMAIYEGAFGSNHPDVAKSLNNLAELLCNQGRYEEARSLHEKALGIYGNELGLDHPDFAMSLNNLAVLLHRQGNTEEALPLQERAMAIELKALGPDHPAVARSLSNMAELLRSQGKYHEALSMYERAVAVYEKAQGPNHLDVATPLNNIGMLLSNQGRYHEALLLFRRVLTIREKVLGPSHPDVATTLNNVADVLYSQAKYLPALLLCKRAFTISEKALGLDHPGVALLLNNMAVMLQTLGKYDEALPLYARTVAIYIKAGLLTDHPTVACALENMISLLESQGKYEEVMKLKRAIMGSGEAALETDQT